MIINFNETIYEVTKLSTEEFIKELGHDVDIDRIPEITYKRLDKQNIYKIIDTETDDVYYIDNNNTYLNPIQLLAWHDFQYEEREVPDFYGIHREL